MGENQNIFDTFLSLVTAPVRWIDNIFGIFSGYTNMGYSRFFVWALILYMLSLFTKFKGEVKISK